MLEKFMMKKAEELLSSALPDITDGLNSIPREDGELAPMVLISFVGEQIWLTIAFFKEIKVGDKDTLYMNRIWKKIRFSELQDMLKNE